MLLINTNADFYHRLKTAVSKFFAENDATEQHFCGIKNKSMRVLLHNDEPDFVNKTAEIWGELRAIVNATWSTLCRGEGIICENEVLQNVDYIYRIEKYTNAEREKALLELDVGEYMRKNDEANMYITVFHLVRMAPGQHLMPAEYIDFMFQPREEVGTMMVSFDRRTDCLPGRVIF